jgi:hypothetical protein
LEILSFTSNAAAGATGDGFSGSAAARIAAWGEGSAGLYTDGFYLDIGPHRIGMIGGGIMFRLPASAGFLYACH